MSELQKPERRSNSSELMRYAGLGAQLFVTIGVCVWLGLKADKWLRIPLPLLVWLLPLVAVGGMIYKLVNDTSKRK
ncbi:MAG: AtpZ/AtpI family protein [Chitinophagaceae bacterium]|nr:MAG: AtpZ/AtpI family protein [Chitinophagaceae bacterium]